MKNQENHNLFKLTSRDSVERSLEPMIKLPDDQRKSEGINPHTASDADLFCWVKGYQEAMSNLGSRAKSHKARSKAMVYLSRYEQVPCPGQAPLRPIAESLQARRS
jgi:hypothetical protein